MTLTSSVYDQTCDVLSTAASHGKWEPECQKERKRTKPKQRSTDLRRAAFKRR